MSLGRVSSWLAIASIAYAVVALTLDGMHALRISMTAEDGSFGGIGSALRAVVVAPMFVVAYQFAKSGRARHASLWLASALFLLSLMTAIPRGAYASGWYLQPLLVMIVALTLGVVPGLTLALLACGMHVGTALWVGAGSLQQTHSTVLGHSLAVAAVILATGLLGAFLHHALCVAIEVETTQRRRIAETMKALRHRERLLRHAMRLQTIGSLTSMVVHQLRNHFQVMMGNVALGRHSEGEQKDRYLAGIQTSLEKSNSLLDQLLRMAHPGQEEVVRVDLGAEVRAIVEHIGQVLTSSMQLEVDVGNHPLPVRLDRRGLEDALLNLVINAKHAMGGRGRIGIVVRPDGPSAATIRVQDSGSGIRTEHLPHLFKPFFTTKPAGQGTGLGLAAVDRYMTASGGHIDVDSQVGEGTSFTLWFPLAAMQDSAPPSDTPRNDSDRDDPPSRATG
jgi:signal transduction histidine kinase